MTPNGQGTVKEEKCRSTTDCFDLSNIKEEEFDQHVVYIVPDVQTEANCTNRAEASLPRNLVLKPSQALSDVSTGRSRTADEYPVSSTASPRRFWASGARATFRGGPDSDRSSGRYTRRMQCRRARTANISGG